MKYTYLILLLILSSCNGQKNNDSTGKPKVNQISKVNNNQNRREKELNYIKQRNANIEYFKNKEINNQVNKQMNDSILELEKNLKNILIDTKIKNINKTGQITLQTFFPEIGFGMLDGLLTKKDTMTLICTSNYIFSDFFPKYHLDNLSPSELENILNNAFASDYTITNMSSFKINTKENIQAYGLISVDAQEVGPFTPNTLYVLAFVDNNIYLIQKSIEKELKLLENCTNTWNNTYQVSEDKAWENYCECFKKEFKDNKQFLNLKNEIYEMLRVII